jgi:hypothetical protein
MANDATTQFKTGALDMSHLGNGLRHSRTGMTDPLGKLRNLQIRDALDALTDSNSRQG